MFVEFFERLSTAVECDLPRLLSALVLTGTVVRGSLALHKPDVRLPAIIHDDLPREDRSPISKLYGNEILHLVTKTDRW